jgi:hypothetical protein
MSIRAIGLGDTAANSHLGRCCRRKDDPVHRGRAILSGAADRNHCAVRCGRSEGRDCAHARPANAGDNRTTGAERKHCRRGWFDQSWPRRPRSARRLYRRPRELGARGCQLDFDLLKDVQPVAQLPDNPLLIVARKAGPGEQGVDRLAESQPGQGIRWDLRRWRRTSRACFSRAPASNSYPIVVRIRPREPLRINSGAPQRCTQTGTQGSDHGHHVLLQSGAGRSHLGLQA